MFHYIWNPFAILAAGAGFGAAIWPRRDAVAHRFSRSRQAWVPTEDPYTVPSINPPDAFRLVTWNVDAFSYNKGLRMRKALDFLATAHHPGYFAAPGSLASPTIVLLQEVHIDMFHHITSHPWVRDNFNIVPSSPASWPHGAAYGNVSLISKTIPIQSASIVDFPNSSMGRCLLFVDIILRPHNGDGAYIVRVGNTHLESMEQGARARRDQVHAIASYLRSEVDCGLVAGDMNLVAEADRGLEESAGLRDAHPPGVRLYTWGDQPPQTQFPKRRLDKVLFTDRGILDIAPPQWLAKGLTYGAGMGTTAFVSDHIALETRVAVRPQGYYPGRRSKYLRRNARKVGRAML